MNRAIRFADNGVSSDVQNIYGSVSKSRIRFTADGEAMPSITAGAHIEYGASNNAGGSLDSEQDDKAAGFDARHALLYFSGDFGKITLSKAPSAGNGVMWTNHNGAWMGTEYSPDTNSAIGVMNTDGSSSGYSVFSFFASVNTPRMNTLRYDTPSIGPISVSGSVQKDSVTDHNWHFGANLGHDTGADNVIASLLYEQDKLGIADGLAFANGTSVNTAWGWGDAGGQDYEDMYINVSHSWGSMKVTVDYRSTENGADMEGRAIGLGAQYALGGGVDVYAGFNNYSFDNSSMDLEDISGFHVGSPVKFN